MGRLITGRYRLIGRIGRGGMADVYRARDLATGRDVALKRLRRSRTGSRSAELRFRREFRTLASLQHPRIVEVYDYGVEAGAAFYTMQLLAGGDLRKWRSRPVPQICSILRDICTALALVHTRRLIHRDVTPRNVRLGARGEAKLIDFGILATVGEAGAIAGTPPFTPPESLARAPLDHRADLYGLGAMAFWLLTGKHARPARTMEELRSVIARPIPSVSSLVEVPAGLDELVSALLSDDPLARPSDAAEVAERLSLIAGLPRLPETDVPAELLGATSLVGRERELDLFRRHRASAAQGHTRTLICEGPPGIGKSRLLAEVALAAKMEGARVVRADGGAEHRPFAVAAQLVDELLTLAPKAVNRATERYPLVAELFPALSSDGKERIPEQFDPGEQWVRVHTALRGWWRELLDRPLVMLVDDLQWADEASVALLLALTRDGDLPLLVVGALRSDLGPEPCQDLTAFRDAATPVPLTGLPVRSVSELARLLFGSARDSDRLGAWMHRHSGGNPQHCFELARHLVDSGVVQYSDGVWVKVGNYSAVDTPKSLQDALDERIARLPSSALRLGIMMAISGRGLSLPQCVALGSDEEEIFLALDRLIQRDFVLSYGETYRLRDGSIREAMLRAATPETVAAYHLALATLLTPNGEIKPGTEGEVGWHYLRGGEKLRGAALLETCGRELYRAQAFRDAIAPLEAAIAVYDEYDVHPARRLELRTQLVMAGSFFNRDAAQRHLRRALEMARRCAGLDSAKRLGRYLPKRLALAVGVGWKWLRWKLQRRAECVSPLDGMVAYMRLLVPAFTLELHMLHFDRATELLRDNQLIPRDRHPLLTATLLLCESIYDAFDGDMEKVWKNSEVIDRIFAEDYSRPVDELSRRTARAMARWLRTIAAQQGPAHRFEDACDAVEELRLDFLRAALTHARAAFYRMRGESARAERCLREAEREYALTGVMWMAEERLVYHSALAYGCLHDLPGLRLAVARLRHLDGAGYGSREILDLAEGEYLRELGEYDESITALERVAREARMARHRHFAYGALAETYLAAGRLDEAADVARSGIEASSLTPVARIRCARALALADAARGAVDAATERIEQLLVEAEEYEIAGLCGGVHEAAARIALARRDRGSYHEHVARAEKWFRPTGNPTLLARLERLKVLGRRVERLPSERLPAQAFEDMWSRWGQDAGDGEATWAATSAATELRTRQGRLAPADSIHAAVTRALGE